MATARLKAALEAREKPVGWMMRRIGSWTILSSYCGEVSHGSWSGMRSERAAP